MKRTEDFPIAERQKYHSTEFGRLEDHFGGMHYVEVGRWSERVRDLDLLDCVNQTPEYVARRDQICAEDGIGPDTFDKRMLLIHIQIDYNPNIDEDRFNLKYTIKGGLYCDIANF